MMLVMCPASRSSRGKKLWQGWMEGLETAGVKYDCCHTTHPGHAIEIARDATGDVVAVGGDGTINEVISGVMLSEKPKKMGVLYCGTSPDFCSFHNIPISPREALASLLKRQSRFVDVAKIEYRDHQQLTRTEFFGCSCNIGMGAAVATFANKHRKYLGDSCGTLFGVVRAISTHRPADIELDVDGYTYRLAGCNHLVVIKNPFIASGLKLNLDVSPDDGKGFVLAVCGRNRRQLLSLLPKFYTGTITNENDIFIKPFTKLKASSIGKVEIEFDGDAKGVLPVKVEILKRSLEIIGAANA